MNTCGRCGLQAREPVVKQSIVNLAREARRDGRRHDGPDFDFGDRCVDKGACDQRVRVARGVGA